MSQSHFPWLPIGFPLPNEEGVRRLLSCGPDRKNPKYQIVETQSRNCICILLDINSPAAAAAQSESHGKFTEIDFSGKKIVAATYLLEDSPVRVADIPSCADYLTMTELLPLAQALGKLHDDSWLESVFLPTASLCLPFGNRETELERKTLAVKLLTGGVADFSLSSQQIHAINRWITQSEVDNFYHILGLSLPGKTPLRKHTTPSQQKVFALPGHPQMEQVFREYIIDYQHLRSEFEKMGTKPTNGILLHGPTGSGKTYAVRKLSEFLDWPMLEINLGTSGSPYIHQTVKNIRQIFDKARSCAPSIVFLDELDSMGMARDRAGHHTHKLEEIGELLQQVDSAGKDHVLVLAATNSLHIIDKALTRTGRFDLSIKVEYPDVNGIVAVLEHCLDARPHAPGMRLSEIAASLVGQPLSTVDWVVNEASRIAVKRSKTRIDEESLRMALQLSQLNPDKDKGPPRIGFLP